MGRGVGRTGSVRVLFRFMRWKDVVRCERTDVSDLISSVCTARKLVAKKILASVGTTSQKSVRGVGRTISAGVTFRFFAMERRGSMRSYYLVPLYLLCLHCEQVRSRKVVSGCTYDIAKNGENGGTAEITKPGVLSLAIEGSGRVRAY